MREIYVAKPFTLAVTHDDLRRFDAGRHQIEDDLFDHFMVQAHIFKDGKPPVAPATAPMTHEERTQARAALEAAEGRAADAERREADRDAEVEALRRQLADAQIAKTAAESDLEKATRPASPTAKPSASPSKTA